MWERTGFKSIITRLLEMRVFDGAEQTPLLSVWNADCTVALKLIALKNAGL